MKAFLICLYLLVLSSLGAAYGSPLERSGGEAPLSDIDLHVGQSIVFSAPGLKRVLFSKGRIVTAKSVDPSQLLLVGRQTGETEMLLWDSKGVLTKHRVRVVDDGLATVERQVEIHVKSPSHVKVRREGRKILITGSVSTEDEWTALQSLPKSDPSVEVAVERSDDERMIAMEVRFLEVKKNAMESLGFNWQKSLSGPVVAIVGDISSNKQFRPQATPSAENSAGSVQLNLPTFTAEPGQSPTGRVAPFSTYVGLQTSLLSMINLMEQSGEALVLAEPTLTCRSGGQARFLAGGEVPLPTTSALGNSSVQFKPYGIRFEVAPVSRPGGLIEAKITTELSTVDPAIKVGELPGFLSRMTQSEVSLREGQTLVLSGLISEEGSFSRDKLAGLADLPGIGALFRSRDFLERRSELVVLLTPRRVTAASSLNLDRIRETESAASQFRKQLHPQHPHTPSDREAFQND
ncbi:MAG: Type pilus biosis and competence protein pilQ precursor [Pseudomonadota bacterium]